MPTFQQLFHFNLLIPVWQIALYAGLMSFFLINRRIRLSLLTSYLFLLFWLYYAFRGDLLSLTREDFLVQTVYHLFGCLLVLLGVFAYFFLERDQEVLLENLRKRNAEIAELKVKAKKAEKMVHALETQAEEAQRSFNSQESGVKRKVENELNAKVDELEDRLEDSEGLLQKRNAEIADLKQKAKEAEKRAHALNAQVEETQRGVETEVSALKKNLEKELDAKIAGLEDRLEESENLLEKRNNEMAGFKLKAEEAEKKAQALKAQAEEAQRRVHTEASAFKKKLDARIGDLENQLKDKDGLLEKRNGEIADFKQKIEAAEKKAHAQKSQAEEVERNVQSQAATLKKKLEQELNAKIDDLDRRLKDRESLLEKRNTEIAAFKSKAEEAGKIAQALTAQAEENHRDLHTEASVLKKKLDARIGDLEKRLSDRESLLERRNAEISAFKSKAEEAEKKAQALKAQAEEGQRSAHADSSALKKKLDARIDDLEHQLKDKDGLLEKRNGEIAAFKQKVEEAEKEAQALKAEAEESHRDLHTEASVLKKKLDAKIGDLEKRLEDRGSLLEKRNAEIAAFKSKAEEAEKKAQALKVQAEEAQRSFHAQGTAFKKKVEEGLNAKIDEMEKRLEDRETLLQKRAGEIAVFKSKAEEAEKKAQTLKIQAEEAQRHAHTETSAFKKKLEQELNAKIDELEKRLEDRESLLQKRAGEIAALKLKADEAEKRANAVKSLGQNDRKGSQVQDANQKKSLELELKEKVLELKQLQEQVNHKDGLLSLMAKRNAELADLKSKADQKIEFLEGQLQESEPVLPTEDSIALQSYKPRDS
jgi:chromosome segregation ATPase